MIRRVSGALAAALLLTLLGGCSLGQSVPSGERTVSVCMEKEPSALDISLRSGSEAAFIADNIFEGLVRTELHGGVYETVPGDAESWKESADGLTWTFKLDKNAKWSDGQPVTAEDYVYSIRRSSLPGISCPNSFYLRPLANFGRVKSGELPCEELRVQAKDERTLVLTLESRTPSFLSMISGSVYYPQRRDIAESAGKDYGVLPEKTPCNGPFVLESREEGRIVLERNKNYLHGNKVSLSRIEISTAMTEDQMAEAFEKGEADIVPVSSQAFAERLSGLGGTVRTCPSDSVSCLLFNCGRGFFQNENIRRAFAMSTDRDALEASGYFGFGASKASGWVPPAVTVGELSYRENAELSAEDEMTASEYLLKGMEEMKLGSDPESLVVTLTLGGNGEWFREFGGTLAHMWKRALGVNVDLRLVSGENLPGILNEGGFEIAFMQWGGYYNDPYDMLSLFSQNSDALNTGFQNKEFDGFLSKGIKARKDADRIKAFAGAENILVKEKSAVIPLSFGSRAYCLNERTKTWETGFFDDSGLKNLNIPK